MIAQTEEIQIVALPCTEKVRSMLQLQKALREELYETCAFWVKRALRNGATKREISWVLRNPCWHIEEDRPAA